MVVWCDQERKQIAWIEAWLASPKENSMWKLANGLYPGMALQDMEKIVGKPFPFTRWTVPHPHIADGLILFRDQGGVFTHNEGIQMRMAFITEGNIPQSYTTTGGIGYLQSNYIGLGDNMESFRLGVIAVAMAKMPELARQAGG